MLGLKKTIAFHQMELSRHRLFGAIEASTSPESLRSVARALTWLPMVFQDVLRLNIEQSRGSRFERFVELRAGGDSGHGRWFLNDLEILSVARPGFDELFGEGFQPLRDACYALIGEMHRFETGAERVALLLALEAASRVFFEEISSAAERLCPQLPLVYFSRRRSSAEHEYDLYTEETDAELDRVALGDEERARAMLVAGSVHAVFERIFSYLADGLVHGVSLASDVRELKAQGGRLGTMRRAEGA